MGSRFGHLARLLNLTTAPAASASGDMWYRADLDQVRASDGAAGESLTVGPFGNVPVIRSTAWHSLPGYGNASAANLVADRMYAMPFWPGRTCTLTAAAVNVTTALAGSDIRMGLYESRAAVPSPLVADYGTVSGAALGTAQISGLTTVVRPVLHWFVVARQGAAGTLGLSIRSTRDALIADTTPVIAANRSAYYRNGITGALPNPFGTLDGSDQGPCVVLQLT